MFLKGDGKESEKGMKVGFCFQCYSNRYNKPKVLHLSNCCVVFLSLLHGISEETEICYDQMSGRERERVKHLISGYPQVANLICVLIYRTTKPFIRMTKYVFLYNRSPKFSLYHNNP